MYWYKRTFWLSVLGLSCVSQLRHIKRKKSYFKNIFLPVSDILKHKEQIFIFMRDLMLLRGVWGEINF